ncbi:B1 protein-like [Onthophagus taurus]|uniref:B1 protein-like n=1 Tax=Onthophagus taurus TaxID=166361 RepID=UPI000C208EE7|nr:B1 protein-like [Onthophagus taurus]
MKIAILISSFYIIASLSQETSDHYKAVLEAVHGAIEKCEEESGVSKETIEKLKNKIFEDVPNAGDYLYCVFHSIGWVDEDGTVNPEMATGFVAHHEDRLDSVIKCLNTAGDTPQETVFEAYKCYATNLPKDVSTHDELSTVQKKELL